MSRDASIIRPVEKVASFLLRAPSAWSAFHTASEFQQQEKSCFTSLGGVGTDSNPGQERVSLWSYSNLSSLMHK